MFHLNRCLCSFHNIARHALCQSWHGVEGHVGLRPRNTNGLQCHWVVRVADFDHYIASYHLCQTCSAVFGTCSQEAFRSTGTFGNFSSSRSFVICLTLSTFTSGAVSAFRVSCCQVGENIARDLCMINGVYVTRQIMGIIDFDHSGANCEQTRFLLDTRFCQMTL